MLIRPSADQWPPAPSVRQVHLDQGEIRSKTGVGKDFGSGAVGRRTVVTWEEYYQAADLAMMRAEYDDAFADIAERLIGRFGGRVIERTVDGLR